MIKEHIVSYDYLRAFSALMIVCCHIFLGFGIISNAGLYLGGTFVDVFLLISAYLLGLSSKEKITLSPSTFIKRRLERLIPTYYIFLTITFLLIVIFLGVENLTPYQVFGHYAFLNWFIEPVRIHESPLPQLGHLWFMNAIMFAYILITLYAIIANRFPKIGKKNGWIIYIIIASLSATVATSYVKNLVYPFTIILGFTVLFFKGDLIIDRLRTIKKSILVFLLILGNISGLIYYLFNGYNHPALIFWINLINAILWIACCPLIFSNKRIPKIIVFISTISFEIYLIHHAFCLGKYSLINYLPLPLAILTVFVVSLLGGYLLNLITKFIVSTYNNAIK